MEARHRDAAAVDAAARRARTIARRVLRRYFWCSEDIEDCAQEVAIAVATHVDQLRESGCFEAWVATTARRVAIARQRDSRTLSLPFDEPLDDDAQRLRPESPLGGQVSDAAVRVSPRRRQILDLRYRKDLTYAQIADAIGTSVPRVRRRLQGARDQLRKEVLKLMATSEGDAQILTRDDLDRLYAAASLVDPEGESRFRAVHLSGRRVFGGTNHRCAVGELSIAADLPRLAVAPEPLLELADRQDVKSAALAWDDSGLRLALDDGSVVSAGCVPVDPLEDSAFTMLDWDPLPHFLDAPRAEMLELAEHLAGPAWGGHEEGVWAHLGYIPGSVTAQLFRPANVALMMSGMVTCSRDADVHMHWMVNRGYLRSCIAAIPRRAEHLHVRFGEWLWGLYFSTPDCPDLVVGLQTMDHAYMGDEERHTWQEVLNLQVDAAHPWVLGQEWPPCPATPHQKADAGRAGAPG